MQCLRSVYKRYQRLFVLLGGTLLNISIGSFYTYNTVGVYLTEYMKMYSKSPNITNDDTMWIFVAAVFGMGSSVSVGDYIADRIGASLTALLAGWIVSLTVVMMFGTLRTYLTVVLLTYGLLNGIGTGIVYGVTMGATCSWFPRNRGTVIGILVSGFGLSAFIFGHIQYAFIFRNKGNRWKENIPSSYLLLGSIFGVLQLLGALLIKRKPLEAPSETEESISESIGLEDVVNDEVENNLSPNHLIFEVDFWILWITYSLLSACIILVISFGKMFGLGYIQDSRDMFIEEAILCGSLSTAIGSIFWGIIIDRFRYKVVMLILTLSFATFSFTFYYTKYWIHNNFPDSNKNMSSIVISNDGTMALYFVWTIFLYSIPSGIYAIFPVTSAKMFGSTNFIPNYGMLFTAWSGGALIASGVSQTILHNLKQHVESFFRWTFISGAILAFIAAGLTMLYSGKIRQYSGQRRII